MKFKRRLLSSAAATGLLAAGLALASPAQALTIMETENFNITNSTTTLGGITETDTLTFDDFDSSLGTLTGVQFDLTTTNAEVSGQLAGSDTSLGSGLVDVSGSIAGTLDMDVKIIGAGAELTSSALSDSDSCFESAGSGNEASCTEFVNDSTSFNDTFVVAAGNLGEFIDIGGGTFEVDMDTILTLGCNEGTQNDDCSFNYGVLFWSGSVKLTYTYEVPEPATLALFGIGLAGLGVLARRRRRQGADIPEF